MSDQESESSEDVAGARARFQELEREIPQGNTVVAERVELARGRYNQAAAAEAAEDRDELVDRAERELAELRHSIEQELDEGTSRLHDIVDDIESRLSALRGADDQSSNS